jgi:hypothetical protein
LTRSGHGYALETLPHVDGPWPCDQHFGINVFCSTPAIGGELEVFGGPTLLHNEIHQVSPKYDFRQDGRSSELIKPAPGDLIIVNTRRPHAVKGFSQGTRTSVSAFMMLTANGLRFYS